MSTPTSEQQRAWLAQWHAAGPALARVRAHEIRDTDLAVVIASLNDAYCAARAMPALERPCGLIEQRRLLHQRNRA